MPNKKVELILMFTTKKFFLRVTHIFPKNSIESTKTGKITQTPWEKGSSKRYKKADACISKKSSTKVSSKKIKLHKICFNRYFFLRPSTLISGTISVCTCY